MTLKQDTTLIARGADQYYRQRIESYPGEQVGMDASGRTRVAQLSTLFDGKTLNAENTNLWDTKGTGTRTYAQSGNSLAVTAGQYLVRQTRTYLPYFSGKPQAVEITFDGFQAVTGVAKRCGYFSSSAVAPYTAAYDGWYIESDGTTYRLVVSRNGTKLLDIPVAEWDNAAAVAGYDWSAFTVIFCDFLWLGGAVLRLFIKLPDYGFVLLHTFHYAGTAAGTFMLSPNQPVRYEIRSTSGTGAFTAICSQVSTEGSISESGESNSIANTALVTANTVGTVYALLGLKKQTAYRDAPIRIDSLGAGVETSDAGVLMLLRNPTLSAPLTYADTGRVQAAVATTQTVSALGRIVASLPIVQSGVTAPMTQNTLAWLSSGIANDLDEWVLAYRTLTLNQTLAGVLNWVEY